MSLRVGPTRTAFQFSKSGWETDHAERLTLRTICMSSWIRFGRRSLSVARPDLAEYNAHHFWAAMTCPDIAGWPLEHKDRDLASKGEAVTMQRWKHKSVLLKKYTPQRAAKLCKKKAEQGWQLAGCLPVEFSYDPFSRQNDLAAVQLFFQKPSAR